MKNKIWVDDEYLNEQMVANMMAYHIQDTLDDIATRWSLFFQTIRKIFQITFEGSKKITKKEHKMTDIKYFLANNTLDKDDIKALCDWLQQEPMPRFTMSTLTEQAQKEWAQWTGRKHSIFVNSGSSANLLAAYAAKISGRLKNNKVVVGTIGWATTIAPFQQFGFDLFMVGADPKTFGMNLEQLEEVCKKENPAVVIYVQALGILNDKEKLFELKKKYGFFLIEDACAAHGSEYQDGTKAGAVGDISTISTYHGHAASTWEGGFCFTDDDELNEILLSIRSHGWSKQNSKEYHQKLVQKYNVDDFHSPFTFYVPGFNVRPTDVQSFLALRQIKKMDWIASRRDEQHRKYAQNLNGKLRFQDFSGNKIACSISFGALASSKEERTKIVSKLVENGIETRIYSAGSLDQHPFWYENHPKLNDPLSLEIHSKGFFLPNSPDFTLNDINFISNVVLDALK